MYRILFCLPLCLCLASDRQESSRAAKGTAGVVVPDNGKALPKDQEMQRLAKDDPLALMENCLRRYAREVKGYSCTMQKQENIGGTIYAKELLDVHFRDKPHSVCMAWKQGARLAERVLFVDGENKGQMLARPASKAARFIAGDVVSRDPEGADARQSGRYTLNNFGIRKGTERTYVAWKAAKEAGTLRTQYLGIKKVKEAGDRPCYAIKRIAQKPEEDGIVEVTIYIDTETWLQVGSVLKDAKGELVGAYYFRDIKLNPTFKKDQFQRAALMP